MTQPSRSYGNRWLGAVEVSFGFKNYWRMARTLHYGGRVAIAEIAYAFRWPEWFARAIIQPWPGRYMLKNARAELDRAVHAPWWVRHGEPDPRIALKGKSND